MSRRSMFGPCDSWAPDLSQIHGVGPYTARRLIGECGDDMTRRPTAKHFTLWLCLAPANKSGVFHDNSVGSV